MSDLDALVGAKMRKHRAAKERLEGLTKRASSLGKVFVRIGSYLQETPRALLFSPDLIHEMPVGARSRRDASVICERAALDPEGLHELVTDIAAAEHDIKEAETELRNLGYPVSDEPHLPSIV